MPQKTITKIFSAGVQAVAVQFLGVLFFYITSRYLAKEQFGIISWANALSMSITVVLSFGLEQIVVRRIASSKSSEWVAGAFFLHNLVLSILAFTVLYCIYLFSDGHALRLRLLPFFFLVQSFIFLGVPFRQLLNAREQYTPYAAIAIISNMLKVGLALLYALKKELDLSNILIILGISGLLEFTCLLIYVLKKSHFSFNFKLTAYKKLLKEAMPQYVAVLFDASLSRIDWILLGFIGTDIAMANYSFSYRAFEVARLPVIISGTILLPRFARMMKDGRLSIRQSVVTDAIFNVWLYLAVFITLLLNLVWTPVTSWLTQGKYGADNELVFYILSASLPFQFAINLMWIICFAGRKYRVVTNTTIITSIINIAFNLVLIPKYAERGAAIAFLVSTVAQAVLYYYALLKIKIKLPIIPIFWYLFAANAILYGTNLVNMHFIGKIILAATLYIIAGFAIKSMRYKKLIRILPDLQEVSQ